MKLRELSQEKAKELGRWYLKRLMSAGVDLDQLTKTEQAICNGLSAQEALKFYEGLLPHWNWRVELRIKHSITEQQQLVNKYEAEVDEWLQSQSPSS